jgi:hypothetical protein
MNSPDIAGLNQAGNTPMTPLEKIRRRKERARRDDARLLDQGKVSPEELQRRNCLIPVEVTSSDSWKKACLAALFEQMARNAARPKSFLPPESFLPLESFPNFKP